MNLPGKQDGFCLVLSRLNTEKASSILAAFFRLLQWELGFLNEGLMFRRV